MRECVWVCKCVRARKDICQHIFRWIDASTREGKTGRPRSDSHAAKCSKSLRSMMRARTLSAQACVRQALTNKEIEEVKYAHIASEAHTYNSGLVLAIPRGPLASDTINGQRTSTPYKCPYNSHIMHPLNHHTTSERAHQNKQG